MESFHLEPMAERDVEEVVAIERASFGTPWPKRAFLDELRHREVSRCVVGRETAAGPVCGYICSWVLGEELMINNVAVGASFRRRGLGAALLKHAMQDAARSGCRLAWLEVRPSNHAAIHLYERLGFEPVGRRKRYYSDTREDALVMSAFLKGLETG